MTTLPPRARFKSKHACQPTDSGSCESGQRELGTDLRSDGSTGVEVSIPYSCTPFHALQASSGSDEDDDDDDDSDTDDIGNDNEKMSTHNMDHGVPPEHKGLAYDKACQRAKKAAYDKARRSTEAYRLQCKQKREKNKERLAAKRSTPENKAKKAAYDKARKDRAAYDKARRSTEAYRLKCKQKREQERAEEALDPDLARERKQRRLAQYQARKHMTAALYQKNKERLAAKRSTPENKAKKAAYDKARKERLAAKRSTPENKAKKAAYDKARQERLAAKRSTPENKAKKAAHHQANEENNAARRYVVKKEPVLEANRALEQIFKP